MKFYTIENLNPGMRLARPIYNKKGVLLYDRGLILNDQTIKNIGNFNLIGVFVLDAAEPLPPISDEQRLLEMLQTKYLFTLRDCLVAISKGRMLPDFFEMVAEITENYGTDHSPIPFTQLIRGTEDYIYKHSVCTAILCAMIAGKMGLSTARIRDLAAAALLADFGYLYLPRQVTSKPEDEWSAADTVSVEQYRRKAFELIKPDTNPYLLSGVTLQVLRESLQINRVEDPTLDTSKWQELTKVLMVADKYDRMTAMSLTHSPESAIAAYHHMKDQSILYDKRIVRALGEAIEIVSPGQSIRLNTKTPAIVLYDADDDPDRPVLLDLATNQLIDLSEAKTRGVLEIADVMEFMDQRYDFDEETLKQFVPDPDLTIAAEKIRKGFAKARK